MDKYYSSLQEKSMIFWDLILDLERIRKKYNSLHIRAGKGFYRYTIDQESISRRFNRSKRTYIYWTNGKHLPTDPNAIDRLTWIATEIYKDINSYVKE